MFEEALFTYLSNEPAITARVADRIFPDRLPEKVTLPAISFHRVDARRIYTHDPFEEADPWVTAREQFDCWGRDPLEAMEVGQAVLATLSGFSGPLSGELSVGSSFVVDEVDLYEADTGWYRRVVDVSISYEEEDFAPPVEPQPGTAQPDAVTGSGSV